MNDAEFAAEWDAAVAELRRALESAIRTPLEWIAARLERHPQTETFCALRTAEYPYYGEWAIIARGFLDRTPRCSRCGAPVPTADHPLVRLTPRGKEQAR